MAQVKKISVATVFGKIKLTEMAQKKRVEVMQVIGMATGIKKGLSSFGEWVALQGQFRALNPVDGTIVDASTCFLPDVALIPIQSALSMPDARGVEFAIKIFAKYVADDEGHKSGGSPYEYEFENILPIGGDDVIARLEAKVKALPAPAAEQTQETKKPDPKKGK